jgi:hypothetical protein
MSEDHVEDHMRTVYDNTFHRRTHNKPQRYRRERTDGMHRKQVWNHLRGGHIRLLQGLSEFIGTQTLRLCSRSR